MSMFRVRVRVGGAEVEVESSEKDYVETKLKELLSTVGMSGSPGTPPPSVAGSPASSTLSGKPTSMVEYVRALSPKSGTQYVIAIGHYLEQHGGMADGFKSKDIFAGFQAVKFKHANPSEALRQAKQQGFLMEAREPGAMVVTQTGEAWIRGQLTDGEET